jgi:two-component system cell cycle response regulator DivK
MAKDQDSIKILVVEDNELNLKLFTDLLESNDYKVISSRDGKNIKEICSEEDPKLIVMDIQLPNISGVDIIQQLKTDSKYREIPIVAVTAFAMKEDKTSILSAGCEEYISKPISIQHFLETVNKYMSDVG